MSSLTIAKRCANGVARVIANAEEIAFYGGAEMERGFLDRGFKELRQLMEGIYGVRVCPSNGDLADRVDENTLQYARGLCAQVLLV